MNPSSLSDQELNEAIALESGLVILHEDYAEYRPIGSDYRFGVSLTGWQSEVVLPSFATSIDALSEPEQRLRDVGWRLEPDIRDTWCSVVWVPPAPLNFMPRVVASTEARARAEACLSALLVIKDTTADAVVHTERNE